METKEIYGRLFNSIDLQSEEHLELLLVTMDKDSALFLLTEAVKYAFREGVYRIGETEVISKSIRVLNRTEEPKKSENNS